MAGVSQFVIVITDEEAADSSAVPGVAEDIREDGVTVLAVGIAEANKRELEAIGGSRENYFYVQDFDALKNITRDLLLLPGMEDLSYKDKLGSLGLLSLECRRLRGDLIEVYKIMMGIDNENSKDLFLRV
eukprot:g30612.t1